MNSRSRVLAALQHKEPDKLPIDLSGMRSTGIMALAYHDLRNHLGLSQKDKIRVYDAIQQLAMPEDQVLELFEVDAVDFSRAFWNSPEDWSKFELSNGIEVEVPSAYDITCTDGKYIIKSSDGTVIAQMPESVIYFNQTCHPLADMFEGKLKDDEFVHLKDYLEKVMWVKLPTPPSHLPFTKENLAYISKKAKQLYEQTDYAILSGAGGNFFEMGQFLYRSDNFFMELLTNPKRVERLLDKLVELYLENMKEFLEAIRDYVQILVVGDDLGTQQTSLISPKLYRDIFKPRHKQMFDFIKKHSNCYIFFHSCGAIYDHIPDLIEAGVDILNPVQKSASNMDIQRLKKEFGKDLTFGGGGCDTQHILPHGSVSEVEDDVKKSIDILAKDGGFVFTQVHNITASVPPENIVAMFKTANEHGRR
jgi:uroporphyrinogen decarboxylase